MLYQPEILKTNGKIVLHWTTVYITLSLSNLTNVIYGDERHANRTKTQSPCMQRHEISTPCNHEHVCMLLGNLQQINDN